MKRAGIVLAMLAVLVSPAATWAAQHGTGGPMGPGPAGPRPEGAPGQPPMGGHGPVGSGMMGPGMMGMMCPMMGGGVMMGRMGMMGGMGMGPGAGMMGGVPADPRTLSRWLQLRGELLKAMGEVLLKHGKAMAGEQ